MCNDSDAPQIQAELVPQTSNSLASLSLARYHCIESMMMMPNRPPFCTHFSTRATSQLSHLIAFPLTYKQLNRLWNRTPCSFPPYLSMLFLYIFTDHWTRKWMQFEMRRKHGAWSETLIHVSWCWESVKENKFIYITDKLTLLRREIKLVKHTNWVLIHSRINVQQSSNNRSYWFD